MDTGAGSYRRFLSGDDSAISEIITEYRDGLILYIRSIVRDTEIAEDLCEDTFVKVFTKRPHLTAIASFKTFLYTIGKNIAFDYLRRAQRERHIPLDEIAELADDAQSIEDLLIREERNRLILNEILKLTPMQSQALWLVYYEGMSTKETAQVMKKSVHSVEALLSRARAELKKRLTEGGIGI